MLDLDSEDNDTPENDCGNTIDFKKAYRAANHNAMLPNTPVEGAGECTQYKTGDGGYYPTTSTVATLPSGCYHIESTQRGSFFVPHKLVTDNLIRLPDTKSDFIIEEAKAFWSKKDLYDSYGMNHKRGFLLFGPPGSGKTATICIIVKQMIESGGIVIFCDREPYVLSGMIKRFRQVEPNRQLVVVFEDVDSIIEEYGETEILSILDGEGSISNVIFLATANHANALNGRLSNRPSRFDRVMKIDVPTAQAREIYIKSRLKDITEEQCQEWVQKTDKMSIAHLKEIIIGVLCFGGTIDSEVERLNSMVKITKNDSETSGVGFRNKD